MIRNIISFSFLILVFVSCLAQSVFYDVIGFPKCVELNNKFYLFEWDPHTRATQKQIFYFELSHYVQATGHYIKNCNDSKYITNIPTEILLPIENLNTVFDADIMFALNQVASGALIYRTEKTAAEFINNNLNLFQINSPSQIEKLHKNYGAVFTDELILKWQNTLFSTQTSCESLIGSCDFYICQNQKKSCGLDGYNLGYGFKYCSESKFKLIDKMRTDNGKNWVTNVFQCLQKKNLKLNYNDTNLTCNAIKTESIISHAACYINAGFCNLSLSEKIEIFKTIKKEIFSKDALKQAREVMQSCNISNADVKLILGGNNE